MREQKEAIPEQSRLDLLAFIPLQGKLVLLSQSIQRLHQFRQPPQGTPAHLRLISSYTKHSFYSLKLYTSFHQWTYNIIEQNEARENNSQVALIRQSRINHNTLGQLCEHPDEFATLQMKRSLTSSEICKVKLYEKIKLLTNLGEHVKAQRIYKEIDVLAREMTRGIPII